MKTTRAVDRFDEYCRISGLRPTTITHHRWALAKLARAHVNLPRKPDAMMRLIAFQDLADESKHDLWRAYRRFYKWVSAFHDVPNVMKHVPPPRRRPRLPRTLEKSEMEQLLSGIPRRRDLAVVALLLDTGIRIGELAGLRWQDVKSGRIVVNGKTGQRAVPVTPEVHQLMVGLGDAHQIWTGRQGPLTTSGVNQVVRRVLARAGFHPPKAGPHMLRHTFGRHYIMNGGDAFSLQRILGHTTLDTTLIYVRLNDRDLQVQHAKFSPMSALDLGQNAT